MAERSGSGLGSFVLAIIVAGYFMFGPGDTGESESEAASKSGTERVVSTGGEPATYARATDDYVGDQTPYFVAVVSSYDDYDPTRLLFRGDESKKWGQAAITTARPCYLPGNQEATAVLAAMKRWTPRGQHVEAMRSAFSRDDLWVHARGARSDPSSALSVRLVRAGLAKPQLFYFDQPDVTSAELVYEQPLRRAFRAARRDRSGVFGLCDAEKRKQKRRERRWEREQARNDLDIPDVDRPYGPGLPGDGYCDSCHWARKLF